MRAVIIGCFLLVLTSATAQETETAKKTGTFPPVVLKIAPVNLINSVQQSVDLLADIPFHKNWALEAGVGLMFSSTSFAETQGESYRGIKWKPAIKYYYDRSSWSDDYVALAFKYNDINNHLWQNLSRQGGQFFEERLMDKKIRVFGVALRWGSQLFIGKRKNWIVEPSVAIGMRRLTVRYTNFPADAENVDFQRFFTVDRSPGVYYLGDFMLGLYVGYVIKGG